MGQLRAGNHEGDGRFLGGSKLSGWGPGWIGMEGFGRRQVVSAVCRLSVWYLEADINHYSLLSSTSVLLPVLA